MTRPPTALRPSRRRTEKGEGCGPARCPSRSKDIFYAAVAPLRHARCDPPSRAELSGQRVEQWLETLRRNCPASVPATRVGARLPCPAGRAVSENGLCVTYDRRKAGWQVKVRVRNPVSVAGREARTCSMCNAPSTLCGFHRLCAESHSAARGSPMTAPLHPWSLHFVTPVVRHG